MSLISLENLMFYDADFPSIVFFLHPAPHLPSPPTKKRTNTFFGSICGTRRGVVFREPVPGTLSLWSALC